MKTENEALLWVQVGEDGEYTSFDNLDNVIDYLNEMRVGNDVEWDDDGVMETCNYWGSDYIKLYYGGPDMHYWSDLSIDDQQYIEQHLEEHYG